MKLKYKKRHLTVKPGETLYEVSKTVKGEYKYPIVGAKLGNKLTDLNEKVQSDNTIEFYDLSTSIGNRILNAELGSGYEWWKNFYEFHKLAIDELEAFDYEEYKANGFKVNKLGDYPLQLETKPD